VCVCAYPIITDKTTNKKMSLINTTTACLTQADVLWLITPYQCSGHGQCIDARNYSSDFPWLCRCEDYWSGGTDMFDLRVAVDEFGNDLAIACPNPVIAVLVVWSILFAATLHRQFYLIYAFYSRCKTKGKPKTIRKFFEYTPYRVLFFDGIFYNPWFIVAAGSKVFGRQVVGTDNLISWTMIVSITLMSFSVADFRIAQFSTFAGARTLNSDKTTRLLRIFSSIQFAQVLLYLAIAGVPTLYALLFDKSLGPIASNEYITLIIRNIGIILWAGSQWVGIRKILRELKYLLQITQNVGEGTTGTTNVLAFTQHLFKDMSAQFGIGMIGYFLFSLPWLWCYQAFSIGFFMTLPVFKNNMGKTLLDTAKAAKRGSVVEQYGRGSVDEGSTGTGTGTRKKRGSSHNTGSSGKDRANSKGDVALTAAMNAAREAVDKELEKKKKTTTTTTTVSTSPVSSTATITPTTTTTSNTSTGQIIPENNTSSSSSSLNGGGGGGSNSNSNQPPPAVAWVPHNSVGKGTPTIMEKNPLFQGVDNSSSTDLRMVTGSFKDLDSADVVPLTEAQ
jgi:hypothetical protein